MCYIESAVSFIRKGCTLGCNKTELNGRSEFAVRRFIFAIGLTALVAVPASADVRIVSSAGGPVVPYLEFFSKVRRSGERVVIDGPCLSACTLVFSTIPRNRICMT